MTDCFCNVSILCSPQAICEGLLSHWNTFKAASRAHCKHIHVAEIHADTHYETMPTNYE